MFDWNIKLFDKMPPWVSLGRKAAIWTRAPSSKITDSSESFHKYVLFDLQHKEVNGEDQFKEEDNSKNNYLSFLLSH